MMSVISKNLQQIESIRQNNLAMQMMSISYRELLLLPALPCNLYGQQQGRFTMIGKTDDIISREVLRRMLNQGWPKLFVRIIDHPSIISKHQESLRLNTRSLSVGDRQENLLRQLNLLTINMHHLYQNNTNDEMLSLQMKASKNLAIVLRENPTTIPPLFKKYMTQKHYYLYSQPLISSFLLMAFLDYLKMFDPKDQEMLFLTSYFKDIGMSTISADQYDKKFFASDDKKIFAGHSLQSKMILSSTHQIGPNYLQIIENHHLLQKPTLHVDGKYVISGMETVLISVMDIIAAMISERPYRSATNLYDALEKTRILMAKQYPQEFKLLIIFFQKFFLELNG